MTEHEVEKQKIFAFASFFPQLFFKGHEDHVYFTFFISYLGSKNKTNRGILIACALGPSYF